MGLIRLQSSSLPAGNIIQVKRFETSNEVTVTTTASWQDVYSALGNITPVSADSKILAIANMSCYIGGNTGSYRATLRFKRDSTGLAVHSGYVGFTGVAGSNMLQQSMTLLDTPNTTTNVTYGIQVYIGGAGATGYQFSYDDGGGEQISELILMEIAG